MKPSLRPGISKTRSLMVDQERTIGFMGEEGRVYATPSLARDIEHVCRDLISEHLDAGEDSVGVEITLRHLAATLPGMEVKIIATITAIDGRRITCEVSAKDELEPIGEGKHTRFVVDRERTYQRLRAKAAKRLARD